MDDIKKESTIKDVLLATIEEHIDAQNAKGLKKYGETLDDCSVDGYDWNKMALEEAIDLMQYQQKENGKLNELLKEKDEEIATMQYFLSRYQQKAAAAAEPGPSPGEALDSAVKEYRAVSERGEIIGKLVDELQHALKENRNLSHALELSQNEAKTYAAIADRYQKGLK